MNELINLLQEFAFNLAVLALPVISAFLIALLKAWIDKVLADVEAQRPKLAEAIKEAVSLAVKAAEGMELGGFIEDKKQYALNIAQNWLDSEGWDEVDIDVLEAAIEAEVLKVFNRVKAGPEADMRNWNAW